MEFRSEAKKTSRISVIQKEEPQKSLSSLWLSSRNDQKKKCTNKFRAWTIWISKNPPPRLKRNSRFVPCVDGMSFDTNQRSTTAAPQTPPDSPQASVLKLETQCGIVTQTCYDPWWGAQKQKTHIQIPETFLYPYCYFSCCGRG